MIQRGVHMYTYVHEYNNKKGHCNFTYMHQQYFLIRLCEFTVTFYCIL